jgi:hypothetical protein
VLLKLHLGVEVLKELLVLGVGLLEWLPLVLEAGQE